MLVGCRTRHHGFYMGMSHMAQPIRSVGLDKVSEKYNSLGINTRLVPIRKRGVKGYV